MLQEVLQWIRILPQHAQTRRAGHLGYARFAVLTFTDDEHDAAKEVFDIRENIPMTTYYVRDPNVTEHDVVLVEAERSNVPAEDVTKATLGDFRPCVVLTCGTAGGHTDRGPELGDIVLGDYVVYYEFSKVQDPKGGGQTNWEPIERLHAHDHPSGVLARAVGRPLGKSGADWYDPAIERRPANAKATPDVFVGMILCGEKILQAPTTDEQKQLLQRHDKALAVDMESYGVAMAVTRGRDINSISRDHYNPRFLPIRAISDMVDHPNGAAERKVWTPYAATLACAFAKGIIERITASGPRGTNP